MQDRPHAPEALAAVRGFLREELLPSLTGQRAYSVRVASNLLAILERELSIGAELDRAEHERLTGLVGAGELAEQNRCLAEGLREGSIDPDDAVLLEHLRLTAAARLAVANPRYLPVDVLNQIVDNSTA